MANRLPIVMRTRHLATNYFGANNPGHLMSAIPRNKFMYYVSFVPSSDALSLFSSDLNNLGDPTHGINFKVQSIDRPKVQMSQTELNQYNRKRYAYTKINYEPMSVKLFDTVDDVPLRVWIDYFVYYFGDSRTKNSYAFNQSVVDPTFFDSSGWGLRPTAERLNFFDRLEVYSLFGQTYSQVNYINPKMTMVDWDSFDSTTSDHLMLNMQFNYESLQYVVSNAPITSTLATKFGFNVGEPAIEVPTALNFGNESTVSSNNGSIAALTGLFAGVSGVSVYSLEAEVGSATGLLNSGFNSIGSTLTGTVGGVLSGQISNISQLGIGSALGGAATAIQTGVSGAVTSTIGSVQTSVSNLGGFATGFGL